MQISEILKNPGNVLSDEQRSSYFKNGYLLLEGFISEEWLQRFAQAIEQCVTESRTLTSSTTKIDIEPDHSSDNPRLRRLMMPSEHYEVFEQFCLDGPVVDLAQDLVGPSVKFHHGKLNFKWAKGGEEVKWHQDIQYWPHTDFSPLTIGVYLCDVNDDMGPMGVIPGSHKGELFDLYNDKRQWDGSIQQQDLARVNTQDAVYLKGPAGSVTVHNCCAIHGSSPNRSNRTRPLLLQTYSAGDSHPLLGVGTNGSKGNSAHKMVRGARPEWMEIDGRKVPVAPDWYQDAYTSIFEVQQKRS